MPSGAEADDDDDDAGGDDDGRGVGGRSSGDAGRMVVENGEGDVGGGLWMKVMPSGSFETVAFGLVSSGSITFGGGLSGRRVA